MSLLYWQADRLLSKPALGSGVKWQLEINQREQFCNSQGILPVPGERTPRPSGQGQPHQHPQGKQATQVGRDSPTRIPKASGRPQSPQQPEQDYSLCCHPNVTRLTAGHLHCADPTKHFACTLSFPPHSKSMALTVTPISQITELQLGDVSELPRP